MAPRRAALTAAASRPNTRQLLLGRHGREVSGPPGGGDPRDTTPPPSTLAPGPAHQCSITTRGPVPPGLLSPSARARFWGAPASSGASAAAGCWAPRFLRRGAILGEPPGPGNGGGEATAGSRCGEREGVAGVLPRGGAPEIPRLGEGCVPTGIPLWEGVRRGRSPRIPTGTLRWGVGVPGMPARGEGEGRGRYGAGRQPGSRSRGTAPPRRLLPAAPRRPRAGIAGRRAGLRHSGEPPGGVGVGEGRVSGMNGPPDPAGWGTGLPPPPPPSPNAFAGPPRSARASGGGPARAAVTPSPPGQARWFRPPALPAVQPAPRRQPIRAQRLQPRRQAPPPAVQAASPPGTDRARTRAGTRTRAIYCQR